MRAANAWLSLPPDLAAIAGSEYPRFSEAEYAARAGRLGAVMAEAGVDHLLVVTDHRAGNAPQWLTGWPGTVEAYVVFRPGEPMSMFMEWYNHVPLARRLAPGVEVHWGGHEGIVKTIAELKRRGARRVGVIGPLVHGKWVQLEQAFAVLGLEKAYVGLRLIKSAEELQWLRIGAAFSDAGFASLLEGARAGMTERELAALVEQPYIAAGGTTAIHFIGCTAMAQPHLCVPPQLHSTRRLGPGDVVFCELSASFWDYPGQVLRSFTVEAEPTPLYRELHAVGEAAFDAVTARVREGATMQELVDAGRMIESAGFSIWDDLVHGYGGGYFPPILSLPSRPSGPLPEMTLRENMVLVVQPNVISADRCAGVQVGEMIRVTRTGFERMHAMPRGFFRAGQALSPG
jgi:Xaa-Pro dipeptidase